jgi:hypothetical protein
LGSVDRDPTLGQILITHQKPYDHILSRNHLWALLGTVQVVIISAGSSTVMKVKPSSYQLTQLLPISWGSRLLHLQMYRPSSQPVNKTQFYRPVSLFYPTSAPECSRISAGLTLIMTDSPLFLHAHRHLLLYSFNKHVLSI